MITLSGLHSNRKGCSNCESNEARTWKFIRFKKNCFYYTKGCVCVLSVFTNWEILSNRVLFKSYQAGLHLMDLQKMFAVVSVIECRLGFELIYLTVFFIARPISILLWCFCDSFLFTTYDRRSIILLLKVLLSRN